MDVLNQNSPEYEVLRKPPVARFADARPEAIVRCRSASDVADALLLARERGLDVAVRSGGHCFAGRSTTRGILIDVGPIDHVTVAERVARVGAGARLGQIYNRLAEDGVTIAGGCGPTVGIAGLTLGGGLGILGRQYGLTCDQLISADVVLADGRPVSCDARENPDLLWALRGAGGGQFGVVTSMRMQVVPVTAATALNLIWASDHAAAAISAWQAWGPAGPDELAASLLLVVPSDVDRPASVHVFGAFLGPESQALELMRGLVADIGAEPVLAQLEHLPYREVKRYLADHGPGDAGAPADEPHGFSKSEFFRRALPRECIAELVAHACGERTQGQARILDFTPWGGAYNRVAPDATAFVHRSERFLLKQEVQIDADRAADQEREARDWLAESWALVHPFGTGGVYANFPDPDLEDPARAYHGSNLARLRRIKAKYDPENLFRFDGSIDGHASSVST